MRWPGSRRARGAECVVTQLVTDDELQVQKRAARAEKMGEEGRDEAAVPGLEIPARIHRSVEVAHQKGGDLQVKGGDHRSDLSREGRAREVPLERCVHREKAEAAGEALPRGNERPVDAGHGVKPAPGSSARGKGERATPGAVRKATPQLSP